jgi:predicted phosphodiesterase
MRVALIADIHGNAVALDAALADIARAGSDRIICLGDVAALGPQPREVIGRLRTLGRPNVMGNADAELLDPSPADAEDETSRHFQEINLWSAALLAPADKEFLRGFQPTVSQPLEGGATLLCFHGSPRSYDEIIEATTPGSNLDEMLAGYPAQVYAGGHTHIQLLRRHKDALILNTGSIGLPMNPVPPPVAGVRNPGWAEYALITSEGPDLSITLRRVPYDVEALVEAARRSGMPHVEEWAADWVPA